MQSDQINELAGALVKAQSLFPAVTKGKTAEIPMKAGGSYSYTYADLADIVQLVLPVLKECGLGFTQSPSVVNGLPALTTTLIHVSGQWMSDQMLLHIGSNDAQGQGSAITYARRYSLTALLGIVTESDDDGSGAVSSTRAKRVEEASEDVQIILKGAERAPDNEFLNSLAEKFHKYGKLTDKQIGTGVTAALRVLNAAGQTPEEGTQLFRVKTKISGMTDEQKDELSTFWEEASLPSLRSALSQEQIDKADQIVEFILNPTAS